MKNLMILTAFLILIPLPALAIYGGEVIDFQIDRCEYLTVNISNSTFNEWKAYPDCIEERNASFYCNCTDNFTLFLTPKPNSVGNFDIKITSFYGEPITTTTTQIYYYGYSPPSCKKESYTCSEYQKCCDGLKCESNICVKEVTNTTTTVTTTTSTTTTTSSTSTTTTTTIPQVTTTTTIPEETQTGFDPIWIIVIFAVGLPVAIIIVYLLARR